MSGNNFMAKGPSHETRDSSCYKCCYHYANTNTFQGNYDRCVKTITKCALMNVVKDLGVGAKKLINCSQNMVCTLLLHSIHQFDIYRIHVYAVLKTVTPGTKLYIPHCFFSITLIRT